MFCFFFLGKYAKPITNFITKKKKKLTNDVTMNMISDASRR